MKNSKDSSRDSDDSPAKPNEALHSLMWRQLGFENQFGVSFPESGEDQTQSFASEDDLETDFMNLP
jgi:hypothetical protein